MYDNNKISTFIKDNYIFDIITRVYIDKVNF